MSSAKSESFTSFPIWIPFVSFSSLIAVARASKTKLNSSSESWYSCLIPDFRGNAFNFSPLWIRFAVGLSYNGFYYVKVCSIYACFLESSYKWVLNFVRGFLCFYWDIHMVFLFNLLIWWITLIDLWIMKNHCISGKSPLGHDVYDLLICCGILFTIILLRIFAFLFISVIGLYSSFFVAS